VNDDKHFTSVSRDHPALPFDRKIVTPSLRRFLPCILVALAVTHVRADQFFFGEIPVQYVARGNEMVLDMHRFLHPPAATVTPQASNAWFDSKNFTLHVSTTDESIQPIRISASMDGKVIERVLIVVAVAQPKTHFTLKLAKPAGQVTIAGTFNNWKRSATPMEGPDASGSYETDVPLTPGRHAYKFAVDGEWMVDPDNPMTEDDGMGGKNSVLVVNAAQEAGPVLFADRLTRASVFLRSAGAPDPVRTVIAIAETKTGDVLVPATLRGDIMEVPTPPQCQAIRAIATTAAAKVTSVVTCQLNPGATFNWHDALLYYALTDRFADGDKSNDKPIRDARVAYPANYHGGDLRGIRQKVEQGYFTSLGINALWIAPLNRNPDRAYQESPEPHRWYTGYHGYWPVSPTQIDPHFGTPGELRALIASAHAHGIKIIADLVLHHVHQEHPWWKAHRDWFGQLDLPDGRKNLRLWDEQQYTTWFEPYLPSFDFSKAAPVHALINNAVWWATQYQLDGFRLDAVKHILPSFWWKFRSSLREEVEAKRGRPLYLVGETFKDRAGIDAVIGANMLDGQFDFPLYDAIKDAFGTSTTGLVALDDSINASDRAYGKGALMSPLIGNHDKGRFMAYADGELPDPTFKKEEEVGWQKPPAVRNSANYSKLELAQALLLSLDGVPMVYYGDEIGMTGAGDPDNRRDMRFGDRISTSEHRVLETFRKLSSFRRAHPALRYGSRRTLLRDEDCLVFVRAYLDDRVLVIINRAQTARELSIDASPEFDGRDVTNPATGEAITVTDKKLALTVPPMSSVYLQAK